jgi:hypothetical protein
MSITMTSGWCARVSSAAFAIAADRVDVQVEPLSAAGRRELRDHLLVRLPAGFRLMALHHPGQLGASLVVDLHARLVVQVAPDAGKVERGLYPDGGQFAGRPDAGPKQDRGAPVGASADDDPRRADLYQLLIIPHGHANNAAVADEHPLDQGIAGHNEPVADRIDIPERAVDTGSPVDVDREGATPASSPRLLKSSTTGIPFPAIASMQARWNGVSSSRPTRRTRSCSHAEANSGPSSRADQPGFPAAAQPS